MSKREASDKQRLRTNAVAVRNDRTEASNLDSRTGEGGSGEDDVVEFRVVLFRVKLVQLSPLLLLNVLHREQVTIKALT